MEKIKIYFFYPLKKNGILFILFSTGLLLLSIILIRVGFKFLSYYGGIPGLLFGIAIVGFSLGYLNQIVQYASLGKKDSPPWEINEINLVGFSKGLVPYIFSILEAVIITSFMLFIFSLILTKSLTGIPIKIWKICFYISFVLLLPINLLSYCILNNLNFLKIFSILTKKKIFYLFSIFPLILTLILSLLFIIIRENPLYFLFGYVILFYLLQIYAFALGNCNNTSFFKDLKRT